MASPVEDLLFEQPTNPVSEMQSFSSPDKAWTKKFSSTFRLTAHTTIDRTTGAVAAEFDGPFLREFADDDLRRQEPAFPPTFRKYELNYEGDVSTWFHTEVSNIVLGGFARYPAVLQTSFERPLGTEQVVENIDAVYSVTAPNSRRCHIAVGEFKRIVIEPRDWQSGKFQRSVSGKLGQELRGYAYKYNCPQIFCFDGMYLLLLQFKASTPKDIKDPDCPVDCWVIPRDNPGGVTLRYAFYRFLVQGFRRVQGLLALDSPLRGMPPTRREFYNGRPLWKIEGRWHAAPWGHRRLIDARYGSFYWTRDNDDMPLETADGSWVYDTAGFWDPMDDSEDEESPPLGGGTGFAGTGFDVLPDDVDIYSADA